MVTYRGHDEEYNGVALHNINKGIFDLFQPMENLLE